MADLRRIRNFFQLDYFLIFSILYSVQVFSNYLTGGYLIRSEQLQQLSKYSIVIPQRLDGRKRREANTLQEDGHIGYVSFVLPINNEEHILDLELNWGLFAKGFIERSYTDDGDEFTKLPHPKHHCYYHGTVRGKNNSMVALSTCNRLSGVIVIDGVPHYLEPLSGSLDEHLIYQAKDAIREKPLFDIDKVLPPNYYEDLKRLQDLPKHSRTKRDVHTEIKYIELVLVADYFAFQKYNRDLNTVNERCKKIANIMDLIYQELNIRVALIGVEVWTDGNKITMSDNPGSVLSHFQRWRQEELKIHHDNAQLLTGQSFAGNTVGMASLGTMCSKDRSAGVNEDHGNHEGDVASTMSHEMGHNLGFVHDSTDRQCKCADKGTTGCVMAASSGSNPPTKWSSCSVSDLATSLDRGLGACMFNYPFTIFDGPTCQNSFIEEGEECDCGPEDVCDNPCCVAATCKLHVNATCAVGECCHKCQLKPAGVVCRNMSMVSECDLPEYCTGESEACPSNVYRQNGEHCLHHTKDMAMCYNGMCITYDEQCKNIWGEKASAGHRKCYKYNTYGNSFGNCGKDENTGDITSCSENDKMCGKLMCEGGAGYPILSALASASRGFIWDENGVKRECKTANVDQGFDIPDPGYVTDGSPCKSKSLCKNYKCLAINETDIKPCKDNCNSHGVCNSENHCHCEAGWGPPSCKYPGAGGSIDSGPAGDYIGTDGSSGSVMTMIILLLIFIPAFVILMVVAVWKRVEIKRFCNRCTSGMKRTSPKKSGGSPQRPPPTKPQNGISKLEIQHPPHISNGTNNKYHPTWDDPAPTTWDTPPSTTPTNGYPNNISVNFKPAPARTAPTPPSKQNGLKSYSNVSKPEPQVSFKPPTAAALRPTRPPPTAPSRPRSFTPQDNKEVKVLPQPPAKPSVPFKPPVKVALRPVGLRNTNNSASTEGALSANPQAALRPTKPTPPASKPPVRPKPYVANKPANV